jgi:fibronectin-binding autotransporter adhesin
LQWRGIYFCDLIKQIITEMSRIRITMRSWIKKRAKIILLATTFLLTVMIAQAQRTATVSGNWSSTSTWGGQSIPTASDDITINSGVTVTVDQNSSCASITVNSPSGANGITISGSNSLTVGGAVTMNSPPFLSFVNSTIAVGSGTLNASSISIPGGFINGNCIVSLSTGTLNISGDITFSGYAGWAQLTFTGSGRLNIGGTLGTGGTFAASTGTVNFNGSSPQTLPDYTYFGIASNNPSGATLTAAETISALTIGDVSANSIFSDGGYQLSSTGTLNLLSGVLKLGSASAATTWPGFGTSNISAGTTVEYSATPNQTVSTSPSYQNLTLSGAGTKTMGPLATVNGNLTLNGTVSATTGAAFAIGGNLSTVSGTSFATGANNGWTLSVAGTTSIGGTLTLANTGNKTFTGAAAINSGGAITETAAGALAFGSDLTIDGTLTENGAATVSVAGNLTNNGTYSASTGVHTLTGASKSLSGSSAITIPKVSVTGTYTNNGTITVGTALSGAGTLTNSATSVLNIGGTSSVTTLANAGTMTISGSGAISTALANFTNTGTLNLTGSGTIAGITNNNGGIINLTSSGTITSLNNATATSTVNISSSTVPVTTLTATVSGNTVSYNAAGAQTIKPVSYFNLTLSGSGTKTLASAISIGGNLSITGSAASLTSGTSTAANLTLGGYGQSSGTWGGTASAAANKNSTYFGTGTGIINVGNSSCTQGTWLGGVGTDWNTAGNWCGGIPTSSTNVVIPSGGNQPTIGAAAVCNNITVNPGASLTISGSNSLTVSGNWTNNNTFTAATGTVTFNGADQRISGTTTFYNLVLSGSGTKTAASNIISGAALTVNSGSAFATEASNTLSVTGTSTISGTLTLGGTGTKTFTGNVTVSSGGTWNETGIASINYSGNLQNNGTFTAATGVHTFSGNTKTISGANEVAIPNLTISGTTTNNGVLTVSTALAGGSTLTNGSNATLNYGGSSITPALTANAAGNTVNYNGTTQTLKVTAYNNLGLSGGAKTFGAITTIAGNLGLSSSATATTSAALAIGGNLLVGTGTTFATGATNTWTLSVTGTTTVAGTLTLANTGTKTFTGDVAVNSGGTWTETGVANTNYAGSLQNDGTFTANTSVNTFSGLAKTISGANTVSIPNLTISGTITNNGTLTVTTALSGGGTLTNSASHVLNVGGTCSVANLANAGTMTVSGSGAISTALANFTNTGTLNLSGSGTITGITNSTNGVINLNSSGNITSLNNSAASSTLNISATPVPSINTLTASAAGNTVNYTGTTQTLKVVAYHHLGLSGGAKTLGTLGTVAGNLTTSNTATATTGAVLSIGGSLSVGSGTTFSTGGTNTWTLTVGGSTSVSGTLTLANTGTKTFTGDVTVNSGGTWNETAVTAVNYAGSLQNDGTFTANSGIHTLSGTGKTISGANTVTITNLTISGTVTNTGILTTSTALAGAGTLTNGTNATLNYSGSAVVVPNLTATASGNTVNYSGSAQTVKSTGYANLTLSGSGLKTFGATTNMSGNLSISSGVSADLGNGLTHSASSLYLNGVIQIGGTNISWGGTGSTATYRNSTYFGSTATGKINVSSTSGCSTNTWSGATSNAWNDGSNWCSGSSPVSSTDVLIPSQATTQPVINSTANCKSITISSGASLTISPAGTLNVSGDWVNNGTLAAGSGTVVFTGNDQLISAPVSCTFYNLTFSGTGTITAAVPVTTSGDLTLNSGTFSLGSNLLTLIGNFNNNGGTSAGSGGVTITGNAAQNIGSFTNSGTVSMTKTGGTATFTGNVNGNGLIINGSGGTLNLGSGLTHTFTGQWIRTAGTLNGGSSTVSFSFAGTVVSGSGGTFTPGTGTVNYSATSPQDVGSLTYTNLTLSGSGNKSMPGVTVNGILSMEGDATVIALAAPSYGSNATLQYNKTAAFTAGTEWITPFAATGGIIIAGTSTITMNAAKVFNSSVPLRINSGASLSTGSFQLTLGGDFLNSGTFIAGTSPIVISGTMSTQSISGFSTSGSVSMTKTGGTATLTGDVTGNALTINGSGGTLNLGTGLTTVFTHIFSGDITFSAGTLNGASSRLVDYSNSTTAWTGNGGNFSAGTGTVVFGGANQTINKATSFNNLILSGSGTKTFAASTSTTDKFVIRDPVMADLGSITTHTAGYLYLGGSSAASGTWGGSASPATNKNATYFGTASTGYITVTSTTPCPSATWEGSVSSDWGTAANWCGATLPAFISNVVIPSGTGIPNQPVINSPSECAGITISAGASLTISGTNTLSVYGDWQNEGSFTANNSTIIFGSAAAQAVKGSNSTTFNNVILSGKGLVTLTTTPLINGILSIEGTALSGLPNYGANATLQYNSGSAMTSGPEWVTPFLATGGVVIKNSGAITLTGAKQFGNNSSVPLIINSGATLITANNSLTFHGSFINTGGTLDAGSSSVIFEGTTPSQNIAGFTTTGPVSMIKTNGTATLQGNVTAAELTVNGPGSTLNLGSGLTHIFSGDILLTAGTLNGGSSILNAGSTGITAWTGTGSIFSAGTGTVVFSGGNQTINTPTTFNNLIIDGTAYTTKTLGSDITTNGTLTINAGIAFDMSSYLLTLKSNFINNSIAASGTGGVILAGSSSQNIGAFSTSSVSMIKTGGTATLTGNMSAVDLLINGSGGTLNLGSSRTHLVSGTLTLTAGSLNGGTSDLQLSAASPLTGSSALFAAGLGTVEYNGISQTVSPLTYYNLTLSSGGTKTATAPLSIGGDVVIGSGVTFDDGGFIHSISGDWTNAGSFTGSSSSAIAFTGGTANTIYIAGSNVFSNLTINKTGGSITADGIYSVTGLLDVQAGTYTSSTSYNNVQIENNAIFRSSPGGNIYVSGNWTNYGSFDPNNGSVTLNGNNQSIGGTSTTSFLNLVVDGTGSKTLGIATSVSGSLTLINGIIVLGPYNLTVGSTTGGSASSYVKTDNTGRLAELVAYNATPETKMFPVGNSSFNPASVTMNSSGGDDYFYIRVSDDPVINANFNNKTVSRRWYMYKSNAGTTDVTLSFTYNTGEGGAAFDPGINPKLGVFNGTNWAYIESVVAGTTFTATGPVRDVNTSDQFIALGSDDAFSASKFEITSIDPANPTQGIANATISVQSRNNSNVPVLVYTPTAFNLSCTNTEFAGTYSGTIDANSYQTTVTPVEFSQSTYNPGGYYNSNATVTAKQTSGENLADGTSTSFDVLTAGDIYKPVASGNWDDPGEWVISTDGGKTFGAPVTLAGMSFSATDIILIPAGITLTANVTASFYSMSVEGILEINSSGDLTIEHDASSGFNLLVHGTLINSGGTLISSNLSYPVMFRGGTYIHNMNGGSIPLADWVTGTRVSSCRVTGISTSPLTGLNQNFQDFTWDNAAQSVAQDLDGEMTINGSLALTNGVITTGNYHVIKSATGSFSRTNGYINGNFRLYIPNIVAPTVILPVGDAGYYTPISISFTGTVSGSGFLDASTEVSQPPFASGLSQTKYINRKWAIANNGVAGFTSFSPSFTFNDNDKIGSPVSANLAIRILEGSTWSAATTIPPTGNIVTCTGLTSFSDYYIGENDCSSVNTIWLGTTNTDWNNGSNWCSGAVPLSSTDVTIPSSPANQPVIGPAGGSCNNITILNGASLTISGPYTLDVHGNWNDGGTFNASGSGTVSFTGLVAQTITGADTFYNLTINALDGSGHPAGVTAVNDITVTGVLSLESDNPDATHGTLDMQSYVLNMTNETATVTGPGDVTGTVRRTHTFNPNKPYGFGNQYTNLTFLNAGTQPDEISCRITIGVSPSYSAASVLRIYNWAQTGSSTGSDLVTVNMHYRDNEINGNDESKLVIWDHFTGGTTHEHGKSNFNPSNNWVGLSGVIIGLIAPASGLTGIDWYLENATNVKNTWLGISTNWEATENWSKGNVPVSTDDVLIPGSLSNYPVLTSNAVVSTIEIQAGASLSAGTNDISIYGKDLAWSNLGNFDPGTGSLSFVHGVISEIVTVSGTTQVHNLNIAANTFLKPGSTSVVRISGNVDGDLSCIADLSAYGNLVEYNGSSEQLIVNPTTTGYNFSGYYNLILSGSGTKILPPWLDISGNFTNNTTGTVDFSTYDCNVAFIGSTSQTIDGNIPFTFANLTVNNTSGVTLGSNENITGTLTFANGLISTGSYSLKVGSPGNSGTITGSAAGKYVFGNLIRYVPNGSNPSVTLNIGDATNYAPVSMAFTGTVTGSGYIMASTEAAKPDGASGLNQLRYINRKWTISTTSVGGSFTCSPTFTFVRSDIIGGANTANLLIKKLDGTTWTTPAIGIRTETSTQCTGLTTFSDFYIGDTPDFIFTGGTSTDWATPSNWDVGSLPSASNSVTIQSGKTAVVSSTTAANCYNITIPFDATLTINSDGTNSGSLIVSGTSSGIATYERWMNGGRWYIASSPVNIAGSIGSWLSGPPSKDVPVRSNGDYGMTTYRESANLWSSFYNAATPDGFTAGKGYLLRKTTNGTIPFTGTLNTGTITTDIVRSVTGWNSVGNPYTSSIGINSSALSPTNFLAQNAMQLDPSYGAVYVWDESNGYSSANYKVINNSGFDQYGGNLGVNYLQAGQGFLIKSKLGGGTLTFSTNMCNAQNSHILRSLKVSSWNTLILQVVSGGKTRTTSLNFRSDMTTGLDPTYDAGIFKSNPNFELYTRLVDDNGVEFAIQCLPTDLWTTLSIPVGIDLPPGGEVVFSIGSAEIPDGYYPLLTDKLLNTGTSLKTIDDKYTVTLPAGTTGTGRFFLSFGEGSPTDTEEPLTNGRSLRVYPNPASDVLQVQLEGYSGALVLDIVNIQGITVKEIRQELGDNGRHTFEIAVNALSKGLYMVNALYSDGSRKAVRIIIN